LPPLDLDNDTGYQTRAIRHINTKDIPMKIALIIENSQAAKNAVVHEALTAVAEPLGHQVFNYGMYTPEDAASLTYVMNGLLTGILLNSGAADFVVTGCGTGMGSMLAANAMPGVFCGLVVDPTDAFLFGQINDGNAIAMPYAKGFGWAAELNLQDCYRKLFEHEGGAGYPKERAHFMAANRTILKDMKAASCKDMLTVLKSVDQDLLKAAIAGERFAEYFYANSQDEALAAYLRGL
jgi:ribose 5-phosphate isomerase RpiB